MPLMSQTEYARHRGVSQPRVAQLMKRLREGGAVPGNGKIDSEKADAILDGSLNPGKRRNGGGGKEKGKCSSPGAGVAMEAVGNGSVGASDEEILRQLKAMGVDGIMAMSGCMTESRARTLLVLIQVREKDLEHELRVKRLTETEAVNQSAFETARATRDGMLAIVDRVSAGLAAESEEFQVKKILKEEITLALRSLSECFHAG